MNLPVLLLSISFVLLNSCNGQEKQTQKPTPREKQEINEEDTLREFGLLKSAPDYKGIAEKLILDDLYAEVAKEMSVPVQPDMQPFKTALDVNFDPNNIAGYLSTTKK